MESSPNDVQVPIIQEDGTIQWVYVPDSYITEDRVDEA